ncbi:MAG: hypothetical protein IT448_11985 [Phycisphaerales bacterium]|nr:hypothetical protein [Phycisphaerales bacterium]
MAVRIDLNRFKSRTHTPCNHQYENYLRNRIDIEAPLLRNFSYLRSFNPPDAIHLESPEIDVWMGWDRPVFMIK